MSNIKSTPLENSKSAPISLSTQAARCNQYVSSQQIVELAIEKYKTKGGRGITFTDLLETGLAEDKGQAQDMLKYHKRKGTLFIVEAVRPQQYCATAIKSDIMENLTKSTLIDPSGAASSKSPPISKYPLSNCLEPVILQSLEGYVLPLLPKAPIFIHNMPFKTKVTTECYAELNLPIHKGNGGKYYTDIIGNTSINYVFYSSGIVNVDTSCSRNPYKLQTEEDRSRVHAFFGQIRDRLIILLNDKHERLVPDIYKVSDMLHFSAIKVQVKHLDHLFSIYIKSMGKDTICRVEERKHSVDKPAVESINDIFNPVERFAARLDQINDKLTMLVNRRTATVSPQQSELLSNM